MKNRDAKMRERYLNKEDDRLLRMVEKQARKKCKEKEAFYERTDKDELHEEMVQRLLSIAERLKGGEG